MNDENADLNESIDPAPPTVSGDPERRIDANATAAQRWRWWARLPILFTVFVGIGGVFFSVINVESGNDPAIYPLAAMLAAVLLIAALLEAAAAGSRLIQLEGTITRKVRWQKVRVQSSAEKLHPHRGVEGIKEREVQISALRRQIAAVYAVVAWNVLAFAITEGAALHVLFNGEVTTFSFLSVAGGLWLSLMTVIALIARRFNDLDFYLLKRRG